MKSDLEALIYTEIASNGLEKIIKFSHFFSASLSQNLERSDLESLIYMINLYLRFTVFVCVNKGHTKTYYRSLFVNVPIIEPEVPPSPSAVCHCVHFSFCIDLSNLYTF